MKLVAIIGYGAIARHVAAALAGRESIRLAGVIGRAEGLDAARAAMGDGVTVVGDICQLSARPDLVLDCAGHSGLIAHGEKILRQGIDLTSVSAGALADDTLRDALAAAARDGNARLRIAAGAIGGLDVLTSAREGGLARVTYRGRKPPASWRGTPAETILDLDRLGAAKLRMRPIAAAGQRVHVAQPCQIVFDLPRFRHIAHDGQSSAVFHFVLGDDDDLPAG